MLGRPRCSKLEDKNRTEESEFDEVSFARDNSEAEVFSPITAEINAINFEGEEEPECQVDPGSQYTTTLPSTTRGDKKSVEDVQLTELHTTQADELRDLLRPYSQMRQGQIGKIQQTVHHIDLVPNSRPQRQYPYRAGPEKCKIAQEHIRELPEADVI